MKRHDDSAPRPSYQPIWELGGDDPGPGALSGGCDVLVVGGGVIGLATAALCRRAGLGRVAVVERGRLAGGGAGCSAASAGAMKRQRGGMNGRSWRIVQQTARRASSWRSV